MFQLTLTTESPCQEILVCLLVRSDHLQVGVEWILEASVQEIFVGVVLEALLIEGGLKVLEGQGIVEDIG